MTEFTQPNISQKSTSQSQASNQLLQEAKRLLQQGEYQEARAKLTQILNEQPKHKEALYYLAVIERQQGNLNEAHEAVRNLLHHHSDYGRGYQEQGHLLLAGKETDKALAAYQRAVALNPALVSSWRALVNLLDARGDRDGAVQAMQQAKSLASLPPELLTASSLIYEDRLFLAEQLCRQYLRRDKQHAEGMRLLAEIGSKLQILDDAEFLLESCVEFHPGFHRARLEYVQVLHKRQKFKKALSQAQILFELAPENLAFEIALANEYQAVGDFTQALNHYDLALSKQPELPSVLTAKGHALKTIGRTEEAIDTYRCAYTAQPDYGDAYWSLANLKTYEFSDQELDQMRSAEAAPSTDLNDQIHLCFALGKAFEDRKEFAESFAFYQRGNTLKHEQSRYKPERFEADFRLQTELFDSEFFSQRKGLGCPDKSPVFVVGLPRAGSTLIEQILASHSQVDGTMELANVIGLAHRLNGRKRQQEQTPYPSILTSLNNEQFLEFGERFIQDTNFHRQGGTHFVDKMPNNFRHIALIHLMLPNAKIIDARRHPMACCFSGFKQLFAEGQEFTYSLDAIGRYYAGYVELMSHYQQVLPGRILKVQHEDVISDLEGQVRRILDYLELPFEQSCVDFYKTERAVRTPSSEQVRQPIYTSGLDQWRNYAEHLSVLESALGDALHNY